MNESRLQLAIRLARNGQKVEARTLLSELLRADRSNELAWLWYAECVDTQAEQVHALEMCLRINPGAQRARTGLLNLLHAAGSAADLRGSSENRGDIDLGRTQPVFVGEHGSAPVVPSAPVIQAAPVVEQVVLLVPSTGRMRGDIAAAKCTKVVDAADAAGAATPAACLPLASADADGWALSKGAEVFTVPPDGISADEFHRVEQERESFLLANPEIKPAPRTPPVESPAETGASAAAPAPTQPVRRPSLISRLLGLVSVALLTVLIMLIASLLALNGA